MTLTVPFRTSLFSLVLLLCWAPNIIWQLVPPSYRTYPFTLAFGTRGVASLFPKRVPHSSLLVVMLNTQGLWDSLIYGATNGRFRAFFRKRMGRTIGLLILGPLLVLPLFVRWVYKAIQRRCCTDSGYASLGSTSSFDSETPVSSASEPSSPAKSFFPLSSRLAHPVPAHEFASSFTPPSGAARVIPTSLTLEHSSDEEPDK